MSAINNRLKALRNKKGLTQDELVLAINSKLSDSEKPISKMTVSNWENNKHAIKQDKAQTLADYFGVSVGFLLGFGTVEEELKKSHEDTLSQWKKESDTLLSLGLVLSDNDIDVLSHLLHNMSSKNSAYFFTLAKHDDKFIKEQLESEFSAFYEKNPDFVTNTQKEYAAYLRRSTDPEEIRKRDERLKLIQEFKDKKK